MPPLLPGNGLARFAASPNPDEYEEPVVFISPREDFFPAGDGEFERMIYRRTRFLPPMKNCRHMCCARLLLI